MIRATGIILATVLVALAAVAGGVQGPNPGLARSESRGDPAASASEDMLLARRELDSNIAAEIVQEMLRSLQQSSVHDENLRDASPAAEKLLAEEDPLGAGFERTW